MPQKRSLITLVSVKQAKEGFTFLHNGPAPKCEGCRYFHVCVQNLVPGRIYRVVGLRDKTVQCELTETDMMVVEVVESEIETAIQSKQAIEGALISFQKQECRMGDCENLELCSPKGLFDRDRCEIVKVTGSVQCPQGLPLARVLLRWAPAS